MPIEVIIAIAAVIAIRIIAGMKIPVLSPILRGIWNISFKITSFIPFFGWLANFIIADTAKEKKDKEEFINIGETADSLVAGAFGGGSKGAFKTGDVIHDTDGNSYRVRREGHLVYLRGDDGKERVIDTDYTDVDGNDGFTSGGVDYVR